MIGNLVFRIILRPLRQIFADLLKQRSDVIAEYCRNRHDFCKIIQIAILLNHGQQLLRLDPVDLIHDENHGSVDVLQPLDNESVASSESLGSIHEEQYSFYFA
ncbi:hypothetical protein D3C77_372400 [compost metagenome]